MNVYVVCYILVFLLSLLYMAVVPKIKNKVFVIACLLMLPLIVFRDTSVGNDTLGYCRIFTQFANRSWMDCFRFYWEPGILLIMKSIAMVFNDQSNTYIICFGLISLIPIFIAIKRRSTLPVISLLIFYVILFRSAEYLNRQWIALLILLLSHKYIKERKPFKFLLVVIVAACFHRTALIFGLMYFVYLIPISSFSIMMSVPVSLALWIGGGFLRDFFNRYARMELSTESTGGGSLLILLWVFLVLCFFLSKRRQEDKDYQLFIKMLWVAAVSQPLVFSFHLWSRIVIYFYLSVIFVLPYALEDLIYNNADGNKRLAIPVITIFAGLLFVYYSLMGIRDFVPMHF